MLASTVKSLTSWSLWFKSAFDNKSSATDASPGHSGDSASTSSVLRILTRFRSLRIKSFCKQCDSSEQFFPCKHGPVLSKSKHCCSHLTVVQSFLQIIWVYDPAILGKLNGLVRHWFRLQFETKLFGIDSSCRESKMCWRTEADLLFLRNDSCKISLNPWWRVQGGDLVLDVVSQNGQIGVPSLCALLVHFHEGRAFGALETTFQREVSSVNRTCWRLSAPFCAGPPLSTTPLTCVNQEPPKFLLRS